MHRSIATIAALVLAVLVTGAGNAAAEPTVSPRLATAGGTFGGYEPGKAASTYDPALVPEGARAHVFALSAPGLGTSTALSVGGLVPNREYGAHAHTKPCGPTGKDAGPHFQHEQDPVSPSVDPAYANPDNEIWLDFTTDRLGNSLEISKVAWPLGERRPASVVIHEMHTHTAPGEAGDAGSRLACVNVDF
ncbi:superoxide dismutase, Cu-Zn family [Amycolatopsis marina]|uniref:Superoxide dismutase, Cu-Zn family n=1 Tax=Amycolatopsis marina TaxID=490629 RepID=A0A1I0VEW0_9PSEU|nr:superoxide dismutase family protein [Amycolatopsis marina]SFA74520.1 superoxide dismutase, Cu-Zn family [Amycolatopsis marina]